MREIERAKSEVWSEESINKVLLNKSSYNKVNIN